MKLTNKIVAMICLLTITTAQPMKRPRPEGALPEDAPAAKRLHVATEEGQSPTKPSLKLKWTGAGDNEYVEIALAAANSSLTLRNMVEDMEGEVPAEAMPMPLSKSALLSVKNCLEIIKEQKDNKLLTEYLSYLDLEALVELLCAANYLDIPSLLDHGCKELVAFVIHLIENKAFTEDTWNILQELPIDVSRECAYLYAEQYRINKWLSQLYAKPVTKNRNHSYSQYIGNKVSSLCFSPNGVTLASGSSDGTVKLWNIIDGSGACTQTIENAIKSTDPRRFRSVDSLLFSPDGLKLMPFSAHGSINLWGFADGIWTKIETMIVDHGRSDVTSLGVSLDGITLALGCRDGSISLYQMWEGEFALVQTLSKNTNPVTSLCFSADGTILAAGFENCTIDLWQANNLQNYEWERVQTLATQKAVNSLCFSYDGTTLASNSLGSGSTHGNINLWQIKEKGWTCVQKLTSYQPVHSLCFSLSGATLISGGINHNMSMWYVGLMPGMQKLSIEHEVLLNQIKDVKKENKIFDVNNPENELWLKIFNTLPENMRYSLIERGLVKQEVLDNS